jgi:hypothetical protein
MPAPAPDPFAAYSQGDPNGHLKTLLGMPQASTSVFTGVNKTQHGVPLFLLEPNNGKNPVPTALRRNLSKIPEDHMFAVGYRNTIYPGWRLMTEAEWKTRENQAKLVEEHQRNIGWPLLETPLESFGYLHVNNGLATINGNERIINAHTILNASLPKSKDNLLDDMYLAMNDSTKIPWTTKPPKPGKKWGIFELRSQFGNPPALFVKKNTAVGGKKTRRRKSSKKSKKVRKTKKY